jgi:hypothetical protein
MGQLLQIQLLISDSLHGFEQDFGTVGTPHGHSIASYDPPKLVESRGIEGFSPRTPQTLEQRKLQNRAPFLTDLGGEPSCIYPPKNHREKGLEIALRKTPRKGSEIHQKGKLGKTQTSLEEHVKSSIHTMKVHTRSSFRPITLPSHKISP